MTVPAFRDPALTPEQRADDLLSRLTLEEKAGQITQYFYVIDPEAADEQARVVEDAIRTGRAGSVLFVRDASVANRLQRIAIEESRHGIPLLLGFDVIHGLRTIFPVPIALAATWSPEVIERAQSVAAREARAVGIHWTFAPMVDIARDPRWGRMVEGAGEDPVLGAAVAAAQVRGFQGDLSAEHVIAGPKHFAGYGAARGGRDYDDAEISDSELWNVYLPPFQAAVDAGAGNVMSAYMDLNGVPASGNNWLLTDVLRDHLGFDGFVVSDADAVRSLRTQHFARDLTDAGARALSAGLDMEMCMADPAFGHLPEAVAAGRVAEAAIDTAVRRVLIAKLRMGLFENPFTDEVASTSVVTAPEHKALARATAEQSLVLLKNDAQTLPLDAARLASVAVIGQLAASKRDTLGPWVFDHDTEEVVTILDGLRQRLGDSVAVEYAPGVGIPRRLVPSFFDNQDPSVEETADDHDDEAELRRAVGVAEASDVAVVVVGQRQNQAGEFASASTLDLPGRQVEQLERIVATGTPVVLVVMTGRPVDLRFAEKNVSAILQVWYPGTRGGEAVAATILGDVTPAGKLPFTWPRHVGHVPMIYSHNRTFKPADQGRRYWDEESTPLYVFGHGLSYARFEYSNLRLDAERIRVGQSTVVTVDVSNVSTRDADEVVQLYIHQRYGTSSRPLRQLVGFQRVTVEAGNMRTVRFPLGPDELSYWSAATRGRVQDATTVDIWVGGSSAADLGTVLEVTG
ncbi:glycoside hydrolase family 3 N-terminal domain-containing protein [Rugosimonospora africana]|uniref:beta-glucosidase n=1 Tax=Rugosimonospora africana TaxID=556532 RepID=A0A8J3QV89_9ACTN|nr:glycoside hydrolase family 3 N-terminal domain-containing protein [Rugosimonospora africana]GIH16657.1 beta-glucosidase [Rugosimonospora africana]